MKLQAVNNSDSSPSINSLEVQEFDRREVIPPEGQTIKLLRPFSLQKEQNGILKKESDQTSRQSSLLQKSSNETDQVIKDVFYRSYNSITFREELQGDEHAQGGETSRKSQLNRAESKD